MDAADVAALRRIRVSLWDVEGRPGFFSSWDFSAVDPCDSFAGVTCSGSRVSVLELGTGLSGSPGLAGYLSPAIAWLGELNQLILFGGAVAGPIPPELGSLRNLRVLSLTGNRLTGEIPARIFGLGNLHTLDLSRNRLSGSLPPAFPLLGQLRVLVLAGNGLQGEMPRFLPEQLFHLDFSHNNLSGTLPSRMPATLRYLSAANNRLTGDLDGLLDPLSELAYLDLSANQFGGPLPDSLFNRSSVTSILLQRNNFTGTLPRSQPPPTKAPGSTVDLSHNSLEGELTAAFIGVEVLYLNNNRLTGGVPKEYISSVEAGSMETLYLQHNFLTEFPMEVGTSLPDTAAVCVSYNCISEPPIGLSTCPTSAGDQLSRPPEQCSWLPSKLLA
ncbi:hypothetical protein M569_05269 [Genlisea aurea]|uniref:Leucine-rich repeat-containing N-terminal plant-type domain-containing protein n=1 Tax=Genlisea aurea TaxID=192259 RepID=S8EAF3_9LAMI|nr:hypothetical protein M569_05269 [Genlisea aurea]